MPLRSRSFLAVLHDAYMRVTAVEPLSPNASPITVADHSSFIQTANQYIGQMVAHVAGIAMASNRAEGEEIDEGGLDDGTGQWDDLQPATPTSTLNEMPQRPRKRSVQDRYQEIVDIFYNPPPTRLRVAQIKDLLLRSSTGTHEDREQAAFIRLMRGYEACTIESAHETFDGITAHRLTYNELCAKAAQRDAVVDVRDRIWGREQALVLAPAVDQLVAYVHFVIQTVDVLKFAVEWEAKSSERGGRAWKVKYRDDLFNFCLAEKIAALRTMTGANPRKKLASLKKKFVNKHEKVVTSRNHLVKLYRTFGAAVFLDPTWAVAIGFEPTRRTPMFPATLNHLIANIPDANQYEEEPRDDDERQVREDAYRSCLIDMQAANTAMLMAVLDGMGATEVGEYVEKFMDDNPPTTTQLL